VVPSALVLATVIDFSVPEPVSVVPAGKFGHVAEVITKLTGNVSIVAPFPANADPMTSVNAATDASAIVRRLIETLLSLIETSARASECSVRQP
jgi:hypothetical protein